MHSYICLITRTYVRTVNFKPNFHRIDVKSDEPTLFCIAGKNALFYVRVVQLWVNAQFRYKSIIFEYAENGILMWLQ